MTSSQPPYMDTPSAPLFKTGVQEMFHLIRAHRFFAIAAFTACQVLAVGFLLSATPVYRATALIQVQMPQKTIGQTLTDQIARVSGGDVVPTAEIQLLSSRLIIGRVFDQMALDVEIEPKTFPVIGRIIARRRSTLPPQGSVDVDEVRVAASEPALFDLNQYAWGNDRLSLQYLRVPRELVGEKLQLVVGDAGAFSLLDPDGNLLGTGIAGQNAVADSPFGPVAIRVVEMQARPGQVFYLTGNGRAEGVASFLKRYQVAQQGIDSGVIQISIRGTDPARITEAVNRIVSNYASQNVNWRSTEAQQKLSYLNHQLPEFKGRMEKAQRAFAEFKRKTKSPDLPSETLISLQGADTLEKTLSSLREQRSSELEKFRATHPSILALDAQIGAAQSSLAAARAKMVSIPETQKEQAQLLTEVDVSTKLYISLLDSIQQLELAKAGTVGDVRIIDEAVEPTVPVFPRAEIVLTASVVGGSVLSVFLVMLISALNRKVAEPLAVEVTTGARVLAEVPFSKIRTHRRSGALQPLTLLEQPDCFASEGIRSLRTALQLSTPATARPVLVVTGPTPGIGKTFVSVNYAAALAKAGYRVLLLDCDLRKPGVSRYFPKTSPGMSEMLESRGAFPFEHLPETGVPGLCYLTAEPIPAESSELLTGGRLSEFVSFVFDNALADYIVIDTPPVLLVSDAQLIAKVATATVAVFQQGAHTQREITDTVTRLRLAGAPFVGSVFNKVGILAGRHVSYSYSYGPYGVTRQ